MATGEIPILIDSSTGDLLSGGDLTTILAEAPEPACDPPPFGAVPFGGFLEGLDPSRPSPIQGLLAGDVDPIEHLVHFRPYDPITEERVDIAVSGGWASKPGATLPDGTTPPGTYWTELLDKPPNREVHCLSGQQINESAVPSYGEIVLTDAYGEFLPTWRSYSWEGAPTTHYQGAPGWDLSSFATTFMGEASRLVLGEDRQTASVQIRDLLQRLQKPVETKTYLGLGACLQGDGVNGRVTLGSSIDLATDWGIRFRIRPASGTNAFSRMLNKDNGTTGWLSFLNDRNVEWIVRGGAAVSTTGDPIVPEAWNDVWLTYKASTTTLTFYVAQDDTTDLEVFSQSFTYTAAAPSSGSLTLAFGGRSDGTTAFAGRWGYLAIFNTCPTAAEVYKYRSRPLIGDEPGLVQEWRCTEATGTTVYPTVGTAQTGTLAGGIRWAGSLTGTEAVRGKIRVGGAGFILKREPVLVDEIDQVYELAYNWGTGIVGVMQDADGYLFEDRAIRPYTYAGDYTDPYAYDPAPDEWISINSMGLIRMGAKPQGRLQVSFQGTLETDAGAIIGLLATQGGLASAEIDEGALALLTSANPAPLQIPWGLDKVSFDALIVKAALSIGACRTVSPLYGWLTAFIFGAPAEVPVAELTEDDILLNGIAPVDVLPAARRVEISWGQYQSTLSATDMAPTATPRQIQEYGQEFRVYRTPDSASAVKANEAAPVITRVTGLIRESDAKAEGDREAAFRAVQRYTDMVSLFRPRHDLLPGMTVLVTAGAADYGPGKSVVIAGKVIEEANQGHALEVWG